jgi:hypothetical protein
MLPFPSKDMYSKFDYLTASNYIFKLNKCLMELIRIILSTIISIQHFSGLPDSPVFFLNTRETQALQLDRINDRSQTHVKRDKGLISNDPGL